MFLRKISIYFKNVLAHKKENGSVLIITLLTLLLLTLMGLSIMTTSTTDVQIAGNYRVQKLAFFAAEAGVEFAKANIDLYGALNSVSGSGLNFDGTDAVINPGGGAIFTVSPGSKQTYNGTVGYVGAGNPPRGSGYDVLQFAAQRYQINSTGLGPRNSICNLNVGFWRLSPK